MLKKLKARIVTEEQVSTWNEAIANLQIQMMFDNEIDPNLRLNAARSNWVTSWVFIDDRYVLALAREFLEIRDNLGVRPNQAIARVQIIGGDKNKWNSAFQKMFYKYLDILKKRRIKNEVL